MMNRTLWMPPVIKRDNHHSLVTGMRFAQNSGDFASNLCALRDTGYGLECLYGKFPSSYRQITESAQQIRVVDEVAELFQQLARLRMPITVLTLASDARLEEASHMICSTWPKAGDSSYIEPLMPVCVQINPCASLGAMRHFAYSYVASYGVLPPDRVMDRMILEQAEQLFSHRPRSVSSGGIRFESRSGLTGHLFGRVQELEDTAFATEGVKMAGGWR